MRPLRSSRPPTTPSLAFGGMLAALHQLVLPYGAEHGSSICTSHRIYALRPCYESDRAYLYDLCLRTSRPASEATNLRENSAVVGDRWIGPYLSLPSCLAYVLEDNQGVCGYVLAAIDSRAFYRDLQSLYLPSIASKYTEPSGPRASWRLHDFLQHELLHPTFYIDDDLMSRYPAHLHIDLLPRAQNQGNGRRLVNLVLRNLQACGAAGVHLETHEDNGPLQRFYEKLGFTRLNVAVDRKVYYGRTWAPPAMETQPDTDHAMETTAAVDGDVGVEQEVDVLSVSA